MLIYTYEVSGDREGEEDARHLQASVNQQEVSRQGAERKKKHSVLLPSPLPSIALFVDSYSCMQAMSYIFVSFPFPIFTSLV